MNAGKSDKPQEKGAAKTAEKKPDGKGESQKLGGKIHDSALGVIGGTPIVRLSRLMARRNAQADLLAKLEFLNPSLSVKDRSALAMLEEAERTGKITPGKTTLIEASGGNSGLSLAMIAAIKGYALYVVMPETIPFERRKMLLLMGARLVLTPGNLGSRGSADKAREMLEKSAGEAFLFNQFEEPAAVRAHAENTAEEIWNDTDGRVDILVAGVGSGATIMGIAQTLKKRKPDFRAYAVEPAESAILSGDKRNLTQHQIYGLGAGFIPAIYDPKFVDGIIKVSSPDAFAAARDLAKTEGIAGGASSGANLCAALKLAAEKENKDKMIVTIFPSFAERYISTDLFLEKQ